MCSDDFSALSASIERVSPFELLALCIALDACDGHFDDAITAVDAVLSGD